jgi:hypothetical protein
MEELEAEEFTHLHKSDKFVRPTEHEVNKRQFMTYALTDLPTDYLHVQVLQTYSATLRQHRITYRYQHRSEGGAAARGPEHRHNDEGNVSCTATHKLPRRENVT